VQLNLHTRHHEHVQTTTTLVSNERADNHEEEEEEMEEQIEPPPNPSNDKDVSIEAHSFVTIPLETYHLSQVSSFQCLEEPSYVAIFEDSRTHDHKSRNRGPKRNFRSKFLGYIRWRNILPEGYHILKKKGWKGLVGHPYKRGRRGFVTFYFSHFIFFSHFLFVYFLSFCFILFLTAINL
jgi:hypothetical protein